MAHVPIKRKTTEHELYKFQGKESFLTSQIELYVEEAKPGIPDGGWGWMVVLAGFVLNTVSEGVSFSFGLLYVYFLEEFKTSKSATSWIGSLFLAVPLLAGPVASALVDRYGCIKMTVLGGFICTLGLILSVFVNSINLMYLTFGIIGGLGRGFTFVTAVVPIAFWFEKRRTIALGLAASGSGFGTVIFAPFITFLLSEYNWRGTMLVLSGCFFNMCVCGLLMRDPKWLIDEEKEKQHRKKLEKSPKVVSEGGINLEDLKNYMEKKIQPSNKTAVSMTGVKSAVDLPTFLRVNEKIPAELEPLQRKMSDDHPQLLAPKESETESNNMKLEVPKAVKHQRKVTMTENVIPEMDENDENLQVPLTNEPLQRKDSVMSKEHSDCYSTSKGHSDSHSYLNLLRTRKNSLARPLSIHKFKVSAASCPNMHGQVVVPANNNEISEDKWYVSYFRVMKELLNLSLFLELHFFLLSISTMILFIWFIVPYFYIAEHMKKLPYSDSQASFVLSAIGFTNTLGMVFLGWAGDRVNIAKTYAFCLILCGVSIGFIMLLDTNYILLCISSACFGLFFASCFSLLPSLLAELVPLDDFASAYGLILLCQGIGNLTGPPLAGWISDLTGSWHQSFYQAAIWITVSGILIGIIPFTKNRKMIGKGPTLKEKENRI